MLAIQRVGGREKKKRKTLVLAGFLSSWQRIQRTRVRKEKNENKQPSSHESLVGEQAALARGEGAHHLLGPGGAVMIEPVESLAGNPLS